MRPKGLQTGFRQFLPVLAAVFLVSGNPGQADEPFPNELASPIDEPLVVIPEQHKGIPVRPASQAIQESTDPLVKLVHETREAQRRRLLSTSEHTPWQIMHGLVGLRQDLLLKHNNETINGLEWIAAGQMYQNEPWFSKTPHGGQAHPFNKPWWFEGHINQFVAIISMCGVPLDTEFGTPDGPVTMKEMLKNAQMTVNEKEEVTWTLWALSRYLPPDAEWTNAKGEKWSIERLVKIEVGKTVGGPTSPCGGAHGLFALAHARNVYLRGGKPLRGVWLEAELKIQKYIQTARQQQNTNGSLSSSFFKGREYKQDFDKRMASCGHLLEFLMMALPQDKLREPWVRRAVEATANDLMANRKAYVSCSPLYHATNGLSIYLDRVAPLTPNEIAQQPTNTLSISRSKNVKKNAPKTAEVSKPSVVADGTTKGSDADQVTETPAAKPVESGPTSTPPTSTPPTLTQPKPTPQAAPALSPTPDEETAVPPMSGESPPLTIPSVIPAEPPTGTPEEPPVIEPMGEPSEPKPSEPTATSGATLSDPEVIPQTTQGSDSAKRSGKEPPVNSLAISSELPSAGSAIAEGVALPNVLPQALAASMPSAATISETASATVPQPSNRSVSETFVSAATSAVPEETQKSSSANLSSDTSRAVSQPLQTGDPQHKGDNESDEKQRERAWKATPLERRKPIVVEDESTTA